MKVYLIADHLLRNHISFSQLVEIAFGLCQSKFKAKSYEIYIDRDGDLALNRHLRMKECDVVIMVSGHPRPKVEDIVIYALTLTHNLKKPYLLIKINDE